MAVKCIVYNGGYKYQLKEECRIATPIIPQQAIEGDYLSLGTDGLLTIRKGYAWDGPSGPTVDTLNFMRGSLVHDALYQLMREGWLDNGTCREPADRLLQAICREDGMWQLRAWWVYLGVRWFGDPAADPAGKRPPVFAPGGCER